MILLALLSALSTWAPVTPPAQDSTPFTVALRFDVTDTTAVFERALDDSLVLRVTREGALGWIVSVVRRSAGPDQPNLLYHSPQWHGPYPTDVLAWSFKSHFFPDERLLPVCGYPYEIRIRRSSPGPATPRSAAKPCRSCSTTEGVPPAALDGGNTGRCAPPLDWTHDPVR